MKTKHTRRKYKGLPIVDAPLNTRLVVEVNKHDANSAKPNDPSNCAAAKAISRMMNTEVDVHISRTYVKDKKRKVWIRYQTPQSVSREIVSFDRAAKFEPGEYSFPALTKSSRLGIWQEKYGKRNGSSKNKTRTIPVRMYHTTTNVRAHAKEKTR